MMKNIQSIFVLQAILFLVFIVLLSYPTHVIAQDKSYQNFLKNREQYSVPLGDLIDEMEKDLQVKILVEASAKPYLTEKVVMAPWKFWDDPVRRLSYFLAPLDLSFEQVDDTTWRIFEPWYYKRPETEAKAHLERLARQFDTREKWETRKELLRNTILNKLGLSNVPREILHANISEKRAHNGYTVRNVALEILPGYFLNGNLYEPIEAQEAGASKVKHPVVLCPHGHGEMGRFGETQQIRSATLARMGAVVFTYSMFAWRIEEQPLEKTCHADPISGTMQTLQTIRAIDWLTTLPNVDSERIGITGASGGGTQTFLGTAVDPRITVAVPVVMVSAHFYGGCPCESGIPFHVLNGCTCNAEVAAMAAPRPMLIIAVTQDWTVNVPEVEFPYIQKIYDFYGAKDKVEYAYFDEKHGYSEAMRKAMYPFMAKHLGLDMRQTDETKVVIEPMDAMLYWGVGRKNYPADAIQTLEELKSVLRDLQ